MIVAVVPVNAEALTFPMAGPSRVVNEASGEMVVNPTPLVEMTR